MRKIKQSTGFRLSVCPSYFETRWRDSIWDFASSQQTSISNAVWERTKQSVASVFIKKFLFHLNCGLVLKLIFSSKLEAVESVKSTLGFPKGTFRHNPCTYTCSHAKQHTFILMYTMRTAEDRYGINSQHCISYAAIHYTFFPAVIDVDRFLSGIPTLDTLPLVPDSSLIFRFFWRRLIQITCWAGRFFKCRG